MSDTLRQKYDDIIERSKEFFNIEYDDIGIRKISANLVTKCFTLPFVDKHLVAFLPRANLTTDFYTFGRFIVSLEILEMIQTRRHVCAQFSNESLVNALGLQDRLSRHTKKLQIDHFEGLGKIKEANLIIIKTNLR